MFAAKTWSAISNHEDSAAPRKKKIRQFEYTINAKILQMRIDELARCK
jgi:hypothetical protein